MVRSSRLSVGSLLTCTLAMLLLAACFEDDPPADPPPPVPEPAVTDPFCTFFSCDGRCGDFFSGCISEPLLRCDPCAKGLVCNDQARCTTCAQGCPIPTTCNADGTCSGDVSALDFDELVRWVDLDVTIDGKVPSFPCDDLSLLLRDTVHKRQATIPARCISASPWRVRAAIPRSGEKADTFEVTFLRRGGAQVFPQDAASGSVTIDRYDLPTLELPNPYDPFDSHIPPLPVVPVALKTTPASTVFVDVKVEGSKPTADIVLCGDNPGSILADVVFTSTTGVQYTQPIPCSAGWHIQTALPMGTYDVSIEPNAEALRFYGVNLFPMPFHFPGKILGPGTQGLTLNEVGVRLQGVLSVNGALPKLPLALCNGSPLTTGYVLGYLDVFDVNRKTTAHIPFGCSSNWQYDVRLPAGQYTATFVPGSYSNAIPDLPVVPALLGPGFQVSADRVLNFDMTVFDVTLALSNNGQPLLAQAFCADNPGGFLGNLLFKGPTGPSTASAYCDDVAPIVSPKVRLAPGVYNVGLAPRTDIDTGLGTGGAVYAFKPADVTAGAVLALPGSTSPVFVTPMIAGKAPSFDPVFCKANPTAPIAHVTGEGTVNGILVSVAADLTCASMAVRFDLPPGTYAFHFKAPEPNDARSNAPSTLVTTSSVVVPASANVVIDLPSGPRVAGNIHFGGKVAIASVRSDMSTCRGGSALDVRLLEVTTGYEFRTTATCSSGYRLDQALPPGTWDIFVAAPQDDSGRNQGIFAPYEYEVAHHLVVPKDPR